MGKDAVVSRSREQQLDSPVQQAIFEYMEELQISPLEALWFVEGDALDEDG